MAERKTGLYEQVKKGELVHPLRATDWKRESFELAFRDAFGEMKPEGYHGDVHVKSLIIYSYFNVICETILSSPEQVTIQ